MVRVNLSCWLGSSQRKVSFKLRSLRLSPVFSPLPHLLHWFALLPKSNRVVDGNLRRIVFRNKRYAWVLLCSQFGTGPYIRPVPRFPSRQWPGPFESGPSFDSFAGTTILVPLGLLRFNPTGPGTLPVPVPTLRHCSIFSVTDKSVPASSGSSFFPHGVSIKNLYNLKVIRGFHSFPTMFEVSRGLFRLKAPPRQAPRDSRLSSGVGRGGSLTV